MINQIEVASRSRQNVTHKLYIIDGVAKGCSCESRQFNPARPCFHMLDHQSQQEQAAEAARYKAEKEARDAEAYEKRVAWLESQKHNITGVDLVPHVEDDLRFTPWHGSNYGAERSEYQGCDFCGRNHKSWNCPF